MFHQPNMKSGHLNHNSMQFHYDCTKKKEKNTKELQSNNFPYYEYYKEKK